MAKYEYKNNFNRENYYSVTLRIPKAYQAQLQELAKSKNKSLNQLFIEAINKAYDIDLLPKSKDCTIYIAQKIQILRELGIRDIDGAAEILKFEAERTDTLTDKIKRIDIAYEKLLGNI